MCVPLQDVRDVSITGEFDALPDLSIERALKRVCTRWSGLKETAQNPTETELWWQIVRHHAAHLLHLAKKSEGAGKGVIASESLAQVGSRTYVVDKGGGDGGEFAGSPYAAELNGYIESLPPTFRALTGA